MDEIFEWSRVLMNELPYGFLFEVVFRAIVMFVLLLVFLRFAGKRGVKQLSVFEMVIIIALGSAVGDPMLYDNVGLLPGLIVVVVVIGLYRLITILAAKSKSFENFIEGKPKCLIDNGEFVLDSLDKEHLAQDEFYAELRLKSVEHLGQVKYAFLETSGDVSVFYKTNEDVGYGLPILPGLFNESNKKLSEKGHFACTFCGRSEYIEKAHHACERCGRDEWVKAINTIRVT
ncbi:MAG: DUF421 domain-containing protein [Gelidibacter sp.]